MGLASGANTIVIKGLGSCAVAATVTKVKHQVCRAGGARRDVWSNARCAAWVTGWREREKEMESIKKSKTTTKKKKKKNEEGLRRQEVPFW